MANNSIALLARVPDFPSAAKREAEQLELSALRDADALRRQATADDQAVRDVYKNNADPTARIKALYGVSPKAAMAAEKSAVDLAKDAAETGQKQALTRATDVDSTRKRIEQFGRRMGFVMRNPTPEAAERAIAESERDGMLDAAQAAEYRQRILQDPNSIRSLAEEGYSGALDAKDQLSKIEARDLGDQVQTMSTNPVSGMQTLVGAARKGQSPDSVASNTTSRANSRDALAQQERASLRADSRERAAPRGQIIQTDSGPMLADPRNGTARPVTGPDGASLAPKMKSLPAPIQKALLENDAALRKVGDALAAVEAYPQGLGLTNYLGDGIRQRTDPDGVNVRALVADIGSLKIHDRSGAAVTAAETPRLKPFIPAATDDAATVKKKLRLFEKEYQDIQTDIEQTYTRENGYRAPARGAKPAAELSVGTVEDGYRYKGGDKSKRESWEKI